ncbi:MAG: DUF58 domain-containing protein [Candidatus Promineifilaceae bacterium]|nr:DUF58 domain-containing protein [Candidatus Promineifilaceae bacterium]
MKAARLLLLGILIYLLSVFGLILLNAGLLALIVPLLVFLAPAILYGPGEPQLELARDLDVDRASPDTPITVTLTVTNKGERLELLRLRDNLPPGLTIVDGEWELLTPLEAGETVELSYRVRGRRGRYNFGPVHIWVSDLFGLLQREVVREAPGHFEFHIFPDVLKVDRLPIRPRQTKVYAGYIPAHVGGSGVEFFNVRHYQPGDALRHLNWRANARHPDTFFTNEFEQERVADVGVILDARQSLYVDLGGQSLFEPAVSAAAALSDSFLSDGNRVALLRYGDFLDWTVPGYGKLQRERILRALARAQLGDSLVFDQLENLPTRLFPAKSQLVLVSPLTWEDVDPLHRLRARGYHLLVVSPDPVTFEVSRLEGDGTLSMATRVARIERLLLFRKLRQAGIQVMNWDVSVPFDQGIRDFAAQLRPVVERNLGAMMP